MTRDVTTSQVAAPTGDAVVVGACPSCGSPDRRSWLRHDTLSLWQCEACGLGYSDPQPRGTVEQRYLNEHDLARHIGAHEPRKRALNERRLAQLPPASGGKRLLDVGCGDGLFAAMAVERGWEAHGVEFNPPAARVARDRGINVIEGRLEDADLGEALFDLVTSWDVIEHVPEPTSFIDRLAAAVAPGGVLVVTTLNRGALVARVFRGRWSMVADEHFTYWDARSLRHAFEARGLRAIRTTHFGLGRDFVVWVDRWRGSPQHIANPQQATGRFRRPPVSPSRWDSGRVALAAEAALNRLLDVAALGVGVQLVLSAPSS
jgi:SAM-dependent methyltransferase